MNVPAAAAADNRGARLMLSTREGLESLTPARNSFQARVVQLLLSSGKELEVRGLLNVIIGGVFIVGGLTGNLALRGTNSGIAIAAVGAALVLFGLYRMLRPSQ
jgi:hypothetical protein